MIYLLNTIGLSPGGSSTVHIYTQTIHRTTQNKQYIEQHNNLGECGPCPVLASYTLALALQLRKKHGKTSVRVAASKSTQTTLRIHRGGRSESHLISTADFYLKIFTPCYNEKQSNMYILVRLIS